jgi:hypothetical protein
MAIRETASSTTKGTGTDTLKIRGGGDPREVDLERPQRDIIERNLDPNASRKAIIGRYNALHQAEREQDLAEVPGAAELQAGYEEGGDAVVADVATAGDSAMQTPRNVVAEEPTPGVDSGASGDELVTLKVYGKEIQESRAAVEAAGGVEARQIQLAAEHKLEQGDLNIAQAERDAHRAQELSQVAADKRRAFEKLKKELNADSRPTEPASATATGSPARQPASAETPAPKGPVDRTKIENLVTELYAGDPDGAVAAMAEVLEATHRSPGVDVDKLIALEQARFEKEWAERESAAATKSQVDAVNGLMQDRYKVILDDPTLRKDCAHLYNAEVADAKNRGRPWVVIADEVAKRVLGRAGIVDAPNADVTAAVHTRTNFKRRIPQPSTASDRVPAQEVVPDYPTSPADVVKMYRASRHQPVY